jgi:hypothetical protein
MAVSEDLDMTTHTDTDTVTDRRNTRLALAVLAIGCVSRSSSVMRQA